MADDRQFKFVSPGIYVTEIDNSQLPGIPAAMGPAIIGRFPRGPSLQPVSVNSFAEFVEQFGNPVPGKQGGDIWRNGNTLGPTYASYAAQAWLRNTPQATIVRVLGRAHDDHSTAGTVGASAGWQVGEATGVSNDGTDGGAYGLFLAKSGSGEAVDAVLAAIIYCKDGGVELSGTKPTSGNDTGSNLAVTAIAKDHEYRLVIKNSSDVVQEDVLINFNVNSNKYIRDRINTNPTLCNDGITPSDNRKTYFLGQTFDRSVWDVVGECSAAAKSQAFVLGLNANSTDLGGEFGMNVHLRNTQPSRSGWVIAQDLTSNNSSFAAKNMQKLFRLEGKDDGEWCQNNIKISIEDIKASTNKSDPYGTFSVNLRKIDDTDGAPAYVERFAMCTLNPNSPNYVAKKIGDQYREWSETERRWTIRGNYASKSRYVRVRMDATVDDGATDAKLLPFGFFSNPRLVGMSSDIGEGGPNDYATADNSTIQWIETAPMTFNNVSDSELVAGCAADTRFDMQWPKMPMRQNSKSGSLSDPTKAFFGFDTTQVTTTVTSTKKFDASVKDIARAFPAQGKATYSIYSYAPNGVDSTAGTNVTVSASGSLQPYAEQTDILALANDGTHAQTAQGQTTDVFSLDDLKRDSTTSAHATWLQGARANGDSITAESDATYETVLDAGFDKFCLPMFGGFDGLNILEAEPFRNSSNTITEPTISAPLSGRTELNSYALNSMKMAVDVVSDPDRVECNAICAPGITNTTVTDHMIEVAEGRGDMLAVIDIEGGYVPTTEQESETLGTVSDAVSNLKARDLNTSYACAYYPWVQIADTVNNAALWVPPSVAAMGVFSSTDRNEELWFAPAGFTRGGLSQNGAAGVPVTGVRHRLVQKERDKLYEACINPIAQFPAEGIVIYGQKTLQVTPSALDRINVRRLMVYLKREISKIAATTLFDQNVKATWDRFKGPAENLLASVKARYGLSNYKLVLDESTTTADLIERNIMYAKVLLAPTKAIEFIALDFVITRAGAAFDD